MEQEVNKERSKDGKFAKGHKPIIVKGNCGGKRGRPKTLTTQVKDALAQAEDAMPGIIKGMIDRALDGDQKAAEYLCDRVYGKANQPMTGNLTVNSWADMLKAAINHDNSAN